jgi:hypothetical protein
MMRDWLIEDREQPSRIEKAQLKGIEGAKPAAKRWRLAGNLSARAHTRPVVAATLANTVNANAEATSAAQSAVERYRGTKNTADRPLNLGRNTGLEPPTLN